VAPNEGAHLGTHWKVFAGFTKRKSIQCWARSKSDYVAPLVGSVSVAPISPERSKINDLAILPNDRTKLGPAGYGIDFAVL
jgi:hypothetical protein